MVSESQVTSVRIKFKKTGSLMYISHLDLAKTMQKIIIRAGIDIWYSEGFNPQPKLVFAVPLPVGVESECEYMDIKLNTPMDCDEISRRLTANFPDEMSVEDVYHPDTKFKNIGFIDHEITISSPYIDEDTHEKLNSLFENDVYVVKKSKGNEKEINIKEYIKHFNAKKENDKIMIKAILCAGSEKNLNPELLIEAIKSHTGLLTHSLATEYYDIMRKNMLCEDLTVFK
jgi:radical SAM-linked protein